ncbi:homeobox-leucine zipper ROC8-like [Olea europaea subsp. europaea]|uniref:Homeobox-leucine zipper ROC8-like n=1 Tax=Olea europaea subsp. europaea TaxID=158383 RepID=A0A8S0RTC4_OLEEU|nr:homeobox-leucine zipper ROC8-like [Olea europaea subsp. europaea]
MVWGLWAWRSLGLHELNYFGDLVHLESRQRTRNRNRTQKTPIYPPPVDSFFKECPYPDENQTRQLSRELALDPKQIKFWFQNKRTQAKVDC